MTSKINYKELTAWILSYVLMVVIISARPIAGGFLIPRADFLLSLQIFACYLLDDWRMLAINLLCAFTRDLLFAAFIGPSLVLSVILVAIAYFVKDIRHSRSVTWFFVFALSLRYLYAILKGILFHILPLAYKTQMTLGSRLISSLATASRTLPGYLIGLVFLFLIFKIIYPGLIKEMRLI